MYCALINNPGPQSQLIVDEQPRPEPGPGQLLVKVYASALNRADLMQMQGKYPPPAGESSIPGLELAGEVIKLGPQVGTFKVGDRIYALVGSGAHAEYCLVHQHLAEHIPNHWTYEYAAAIPEALTTANATLFELGSLNSGDKLLVHAAGSGITTMAIQMAQQIQAVVYTSASNQEKMDKACALGATKVINYKEEDFAKAFDEQSLDVILDYIGGDYFNKHIKLLTTKGRLIQIACMQGRMVELDLALLMKKRLQIKGFVLRAQALEEKIFLWQAAQKGWKNALITEKIKPIIDSVFPFTDLEKAYQHMLLNKHFGKIVIRF